MLQRFLLIWLVLLSLIAFYWPGLVAWCGAGPAAWDPFLATRNTVVGLRAEPYDTWFSARLLSCLFAATMLVIGSMLPRDEVRQVARDWPRVLGGTLVQYATMPTLAYFIARLYQLEGAWLVGVVMAGCVPGAMASNVLTLIARGNVSYSVSLTTSATLLSPICVPLAMHFWLSKSLDFPTAQVSWNLWWMVVAPVVAGHLASRALPGWQSAAQRYGPTIANLVILWIIAVVVGVNRGRLAELDRVLPAALLTLNGLGYLAGWFAGGALRLDSPMRRALTIEIGTQNAGLGAALALSLFADNRVAIPAAVYTFGCMATGTALAQFWAIRSGRAESERGDSSDGPD
jgi:BASS family bile acid:Na+ symporter